MAKGYFHKLSVDPGQLEPFHVLKLAPLALAAFLQPWYRFSKDVISGYRFLFS